MYVKPKCPIIEAGFDNLALLHCSCLLSGVFEYFEKRSEYYVHH